jgi:hypothetical protein
LKIAIKNIRLLYYNIGININANLKENEENDSELYIDGEEADESNTGLLQSNTVILNLFIETYTYQIKMKKIIDIDNIDVTLEGKEEDDGNNNNDDDVVGISSLIELFSYILKIGNRKVLFDDDLLQLCAEMDFIAKTSIFLSINDKSNGSNYIIPAVRSLCVGLLKDVQEWNENKEIINMIFDTSKESIIYIFNNIMNKDINNHQLYELTKLIDNCKGGFINNGDKIELSSLIEDLFIKIIEN